jgi:hypothetical protein
MCLGIVAELVMFGILLIVWLLITGHRDSMYIATAHDTEFIIRATGYLIDPAQLWFLDLP